MITINTFPFDPIERMSDRRKVHVFLGAPPPPSGLEAEERPPAVWRRLELCWQDGRLTHRTEEFVNQARSCEEAEGSSQDDLSAAQSKPRGNDQTNSDHGFSHCEASQTAKTSPGPEGQQGSDHKLKNKEEGLPDHRCEERLQSPQEEADVGEDDVCSASIHEYLDRCFPAAQPEPQPTQEPSPGLSKQRPSAAVPHLSVQTQYLTTWTLSQALVLRGRLGIQSATSTEKAPPPQAPPTHTTLTPASGSSSTPELFGSATLSQPADVLQSNSAELFSQPFLTPRVEEGGVVLQVTADGVLCSQGAEQHQQGRGQTTESTRAQKSPSKSPDPKRAGIPEGGSGTEASPQQVPTTLLVRCHRPGVRRSVLVAVVHPCHLKEIKVRSGVSAGTLVPLASVVVTDQSGVEMKVVLWRQKAFWVLTVGPGDILLITGLEVNEDKWRGETVLQSTYSSRLLNLGQITAATSPPVHCHVNPLSLSCLSSFLRERRPLLVSLPCHFSQDLSRLSYATLRSLRVNTLVHAVLRVTHTHMSTAWRNEAESVCRSAVQLKAVLSVEQPGCQQGALVLWGSALAWLPRFSGDAAAVWDFRFLLVRGGLTSDLPELHSTPWSSAQPLAPADRRAQDFLPPLRPAQRVQSSSVELDLETLLSQRHGGLVELRVHVVSFQFQDSYASQNAVQQVLDCSTAPAQVLWVLSGDITFTGCGLCASELDSDANGIYSSCYPCLPHTSLRRYYRPAVLLVSGRSSQVCVQVPPVLVQKILSAPPDKLHRNSAPGSQLKNIHVAAERLQTLLSLPRKTFIITVRSHFLCDENSVAVAQDFTLLDLQLS